MKQSKKPKPDPESARSRELEDQLRAARRDLADMKQERDEANELIQKLAERLEDDEAQIEQWIHAFDMKLTDDGLWSFDDDNVCIERDVLQVFYNREVKKLNRAMAKLSAASLTQQPPGRPLAATEAQCKTVHELRWTHGLSLRDIADETSLSLRTVRTIIDREMKTDRTTIKRWKKLDPEEADTIRAKARQRAREALTKSINGSVPAIRELVKAAKGLASGRK